MSNITSGAPPAPKLASVIVTVSPSAYPNPPQLTDTKEIAPVVGATIISNNAGSVGEPDAVP